MKVQNGDGNGVQWMIRKRKKAKSPRLRLEPPSWSWNCRFRPDTKITNQQLNSFRTQQHETIHQNQIFADGMVSSSVHLSAPSTKRCDTIQSTLPATMKMNIKYAINSFFIQTGSTLTQFLPAVNCCTEDDFLWQPCSQMPNANALLIHVDA